jgi:hypothetical protein
MKTIGVSLWGGQVRGAGPNHPTIVRPSTRPQPTVSASARQLFINAYPRFGPVCRTAEEPGIAIIAIDELTGRPAGIVRLCARVDRHVAAIVGRHDACDLYLSTSPRLALRHLAIILDPVQSWSRASTQVKYRVLDLRTTDGMLDEDGRQLRGLRAEGPAILRCGGFSVFVLPLGDPSDWPANPTDAWAMIPERVYFDELDHCAGGSLPGMTMPRMDGHQSVIMRTHGPRDTGMRLVSAGDIAGTIDMVTPHHHGTITVGETALRDGVLLGRYARCDGAALADDPSLSRVHALFMQIDDRLLAIDTASFNGTRIGDEQRARVIVVEGGVELRLGSHTRVRWTWIQ